MQLILIMQATNATSETSYSAHVLAVENRNLLEKYNEAGLAELPYMAPSIQERSYELGLRSIANELIRDTDHLWQYKL